MSGHKALKPARGTKIEWKKASKLTPGSVEWKDQTIGRSGTARKYRHPRYQATTAPTEELINLLVPGAPVMAICDLQLAENRGTYPIALLERYHGNPGASTMPKGTLLMYSGTIRVTEQKRVINLQKFANVDVQVKKHTFITPHGICILSDLQLVAPC